MVDVLADLLDGVRARGAVFSRSVLTPPWSLRIASGAPLTLGAVVRGRAWLVPRGGAPVAVEAGEVAVVRGPDAYVIADDPATAPKAVVDRGAYCGWDGGDGPVVLVSGAFEAHGGIGERLLRALPEVLVVPAAGQAPVLDLVAGEVGRPGGRVVLDRLLDVLLVSALRAWFDRGDPPAWYRTADPVVGRALELLHGDPAHPWTVAELAAKSGVSRATLARRFAAHVGEPPMAYLARWRVDVAADLLAGTDATVGAIARRVGYADTFTFSVAFKRLRGATPSGHRVTTRARPAATSAPSPP